MASNLRAYDGNNPSPPPVIIFLGHDGSSCKAYRRSMEVIFG